MILREDDYRRGERIYLNISGRSCSETPQSARKCTRRVYACVLRVLSKMPFYPSILWVLTGCMLASTISQVRAQMCSNTTQCAEGCCNNQGNCGFGPDFCGADVCISTCDAKAQCGGKNLCLLMQSSILLPSVREY